MKTEAGKHGDPRHWPDDIARLKAENEALVRIARILLRQVGRGGPSNFAQCAGHLLDSADVPTLQELVAQ